MSDSIGVSFADEEWVDWTKKRGTGVCSIPLRAIIYDFWCPRLSFMDQLSDYLGYIDCFHHSLISCLKPHLVAWLLSFAIKSAAVSLDPCTVL